MRFIRFRDRENPDNLPQPVLLVKGAIRPFSPAILSQYGDSYGNAYSNSCGNSYGTPSIQILRYRGVSYIREVQQIPLTAENALMVRKQSSAGEILDRVSPVQTRRIGVLYQLYCLGWRNASLQRGSSLRHLLLSLSLDYRKGYIAGSEWRQGID